jgi:hypothetical protein
MSVSGQFSFPSRFNRSRNRRLNVECCTTRNGQSFGKYAQSALTDGVNYIVFGQEKQKKEYVMRELTLTLTQSGLLAVLLQRQHYKVTQLAWRRARRKQMRAALWNTLTWPYRTLTAPTLIGDSAEPFVGTVPRHT